MANRLKEALELAKRMPDWTPTKVLAREVRRLQKDKERLEWLTKRDCLVTALLGNRAAIDAATRGEKMKDRDETVLALSGAVVDMLVRAFRRWPSPN